MSDIAAASCSAWAAVWPMVTGQRAAAASTVRPVRLMVAPAGRLAGGRGPAPAKDQQLTRGGGGTLVRQVA
jgi:hypothetical protein